MNCLSVADVSCQHRCRGMEGNAGDEWLPQSQLEPHHNCICECVRTKGAVTNTLGFVTCTYQYNILYTWFSLGLVQSRGT